jgi:hypothetical protein
MARRASTSSRFMVCALLLPLACAWKSTPARAGEFATTQIGGVAIIIATDGSIFTSCYPGNSCNPGQGPWALAGSLFGGGGAGASGGVVGVNSRGEVLTSGGDEYQLSTGYECTSVGAVLRGNVFQDAGVPLGSDPLVGFGDTAYMQVYAVTGQGRVFRRNVTGCEAPMWRFVGALPAGPTSAQRTTWGAMKLHYR